MIFAGMIVLWSGAIIDIPSGWVLCDGNNGTPDLRDRFVPGAGGSFNPGDSGGANNHTHTFTSDGHFHTLLDGAMFPGAGGSNEDTSTNPDSGTTDDSPNLPTYFSLAYIMKT